MSRQKPSPTVCTFSALVHVVVMAICFLAVQVFSMFFLASRRWYLGGNGSAHLVSPTAAACEQAPLLQNPFMCLGARPSSFHFGSCMLLGHLVKSSVNQRISVNHLFSC